MSPRAELHRGNCVDVLAGLAPGGVDACITDPPYGISAPGAEVWDAAAAPDRAWSMVWEALRPGGACPSAIFGWVLALGWAFAFRRVPVLRWVLAFTGGERGGLVRGIL